MTVRNRATAFAPASVGNVGVGFDIIGHALEGVGDTVTVVRLAQPDIRIDAITGIVQDLPLTLEGNTAGVAVQSLMHAQRAEFGASITIHKGIPLSSGMGGSAASAVAAVVAANALLDQPLSKQQLLAHCAKGEAVASGSYHSDNVAPSLLGGLVLAGLGREPSMHALAIPEGVRCVLLHPHCNLDTKAGRAILKAEYPLADIVAQTSRLASFITACFTGNLELLGSALEDVLIEPQRAGLLPGFYPMKAAALEAGAYGCSLSGSGPSLFAWCDESRTKQVAHAMEAACTASGSKSDLWISRIDAPGASLIQD